ncbi:MAG: hypothetical protein LBJ10_07610, partial [Clostridiales bacterium]|nr:hypothetical protein [Clostridiales bacterium]
SFYRERIISALKKFIKRDVDGEYYLTTCVSISAIKPALVSWAHEGGGNVSHDFILRYYLEQYIHFLGDSPDLAGRVFEELKKYHINIAGNFTPVIVPLARSK